MHRVLVPGSGESWLVVAHDAARAALTDPRLRNDIRHSSSWRSDGGHAVGRNMLQRQRVPGDQIGRSPLRQRGEEFERDGFDPRAQRGDAPGREVGRHQAAQPGVLRRIGRPVAVICGLLGVPAADHAVFHAWSDELVRSTSPDAATTAGAALTVYLTDLIARGREGRASGLLGDFAAASDLTPRRSSAWPS